MTAGPVGDGAAVQAAVLAGKSVRVIAVDLYGAARVAADWDRDGWMLAKVRRLVRRARAASGAGRTTPAPERDDQTAGCPARRMAAHPAVRAGALAPGAGGQVRSDPR